MFLTLLLAAVATRFVTYGNPVVIADDQFYLLVGDMMRHGLWPYVDVWDRKPFGLFALCAGIAAVGNGSILAMQLAATLFAAATAYVLNRIALLFAAPRGALLAGLSYLVMLPLLGGQSGQAPVFYNLFVALAALALLSSVEGEQSLVRRRAFAAMMACGIAMAIKPVALVEGGFIGLAFLWLLGRGGASGSATVGTGVAMIGIALLPTLLPLLGYALAGQQPLDAFVQANFVSIFRKQSFGATAHLAGLAYFLLYTSPLLLLATFGAVLRRRSGGSLRSTLLVGWVAAAIGGYLIVPHFFDHYALPMLAPLSVSAANAFDRRNGLLYFAGLTAFCLIQGSMLDWRGNRAAKAGFDRLSQAVDKARRGGCLYVADGPSWLYVSTHACRVTRYLFPDHLTLSTEAGAVGTDTGAELARIVAARPAVVVTRDHGRGKDNPRVQRILMPALARGYRVVAAVPAEPRPGSDLLRVWQRSDLAPPVR